MGKLTPEKRQKIIDKVLGVVKRLDNKKTMSNYNRYKDHLEGMSDPEFEAWANSMGHELDDTIQIFQLPFEEMKMTQIKDAADFLEIPLEEYIWYRHNDPEGIRTKMRVPVGFVHVKRVQQLLAKKNRYAFDTEEIELKSGLVITWPFILEIVCLNSLNCWKPLRAFRTTTQPVKVIVKV